MQFQNNDMDDLLRRAAEDYPLDTSGADWNKVLNALQEDEKKEAAAVPVRKSSRRRFLWLLLLLPLGLVCNYYYGNGLLKGTNNDQKKHAGFSEVDNNQPVPSNNNNSQEIKTENNSSGDPVPENQLQEKSNKNTINNIGVNGLIKQTTEPGINPPGISLEEKQKSSQKISSQPVTEKKGIGNKAGENSYTQKNEPFDHGKPAIKDENFNSKNEPVNRKDDASLASPVSANRQRAEGYRKPYEWKGEQALPLTSMVSDRFNSSYVAKEEKQKAPAKKFYAGIMGGLDLTTVKFQKVEQYGHDYGLLLGYRFNNKWSVETGLYRDSKDYYSDGKYFNTKKIYLPPNTKITEVSGNCLMWEIPVNVKYDFPQSRKQSWFATAGLSSYLMKKEDYSYVYYYGGSGTSATHYRSYKNASRNLFSVLNLSAGYSRSLGKIGELRVEPYFKLPLSKMGVGEMPLMSAGLHIGVTRSLF